MDHHQEGYFASNSRQVMFSKSTYFPQLFFRCITNECIRNDVPASEKTSLPRGSRITKENYNDEKRPSSSYRNPLTGTGLTSSDEYKSKGNKRKGKLKIFLQSVGKIWQIYQLCTINQSVSLLSYSISKKIYELGKKHSPVVVIFGIFLTSKNTHRRVTFVARQLSR